MAECAGYLRSKGDVIPNCIQADTLPPLAGFTTFLTISLMIFTFNIGVGMTVGLFSYPLIKLCTGRAREVSGGMWVLAALSLTFFVFMPKG